MLNFALDEVLRDLSTQGRFFVVCFNAGVRGLGEGAWVPNLCPPVPVPSIHPSAWNRNSRKFAPRNSYMAYKDSPYGGCA
jgi:hypothetical protein